MILSSPPSSSAKKLWPRPASSAISMTSFTKCQETQKNKNTIWLQPQSNRSQPCIEENGSRKPTSPSSTVGLHLASEKKQEPTEKTPGESSEFINSRRSNNSVSPLLKSHGTCTKKWPGILKNFINHWSSLIDWSPSSQEHLMMPPQRSTTFRPGSPVITTTENWSHAQTALISRQGIWEFDVVQRKKM